MALTLLGGSPEAVAGLLSDLILPATGSAAIASGEVHCGSLIFAQTKRELARANN